MGYLRRDDEIPLKGKGSRIGHKMLRFVDEYMVDLIGSKAVLRAGYKTTNPNRVATELLNHPHVIRELDIRMAEKRERNELSADYLVNKLIAIIEATEKTNPQAALRGIELAGKSIALWKERQEITGADGGSIEIEQRTQEGAQEFIDKLERLAQSSGDNVVILKAVK